MIKIPAQAKYSQPNSSDLFGNLYYTKSVDFNESGYLKLSDRAVSLKNSVSDTDFDIVSSFGRTGNGDWYVASTDLPYILTQSDTTTSTLALDAGASVPALSINSYGIWWRNLWHVTTQTRLFYKTPSSGDWTDTGISLTTGKSHPIVSLESQVGTTIAIGNGNLLIQLDTSYSVAFAQMELPTDYEIIGLAYNNNIVGIATRIASTVASQSKETRFFTWTGNTTVPSSGYGVGSDTIIDVAPYRSSFVLLNRKGQLLYFNGGGFETLASFPIYFQDVIWGSVGSKNSIGNVIKVDGERILINIDSELSMDTSATYIENFLGGIWCYDKNVGLYHKYAPSISQATVIGIRQADVNTTTNAITVYGPESMPTSVTLPETGNPIKVLNSTIAPLQNGTVYYIIKVSPTQFKLATSYANAIALIPIDLTTTGGTNSYFMAVNLTDYGQSRVARQGSIGIQGFKENSYSDVIFSGELYPADSTSKASYLNISVFGFKNIGYFVTSKINSQSIEDNIQKLFIKYRPLKASDKIKLKYKNVDVIGLPEIAACTATSSTVLTTTTYIPNSTAYTGEIECEVISGAGGGQMVKVTSITESSGTYTITLSEALEGVAVGNVMTVKLDNFAQLQTITSTDTKGWLEMPVARHGKWTKFKVVLEGSDTTIEELQINNTTQIPGV